jgi:hypothetical protein
MGNVFHGFRGGLRRRSTRGYNPTPRWGLKIIRTAANRGRSIAGPRATIADLQSTT